VIEWSGEGSARREGRCAGAAGGIGLEGRPWIKAVGGRRFCRYGHLGLHYMALLLERFVVLTITWDIRLTYPSKREPPRAQLNPTRPNTTRSAFYPHKYKQIQSTQNHTTSKSPITNTSRNTNPPLEHHRPTMCSPDCNLYTVCGHHYPRQLCTSGLSYGPDLCHVFQPSPKDVKSFTTDTCPGCKTIYKYGSRRR